MKEIPLNDAVVAITGGARGIGFETAKAFAAKGARVFIGDLDEDASQKAAAEFGGQGFRLDVRSKESYASFLTSVEQAAGPVDVLVNNAGIETIVPFLEMAEADYQRVLDVNLKGEWLCAQAVARELVARGRPGSIVNIASIQAGMALPGRAHYAPSKRGVEALTRNLATELAPHNIRVNCINPGLIATDMTAWVMHDPQILPVVLDKIPMHRAGDPDEIAKVAVFLASDDASYVTGQCLYVDGGWIVT